MAGDDACALDALVALLIGFGAVAEVQRARLVTARPAAHRGGSRRGSRGAVLIGVPGLADAGSCTGQGWGALGDALGNNFDDPALDDRSLRSIEGCNDAGHLRKGVIGFFGSAAGVMTLSVACITARSDADNHSSNRSGSGSAEYNVYPQPCCRRPYTSARPIFRMPPS